MFANQISLGFAVFLYKNYLKNNENYTTIKVRQFFTFYYYYYDYYYYFVPQKDSLSRISIFYTTMLTIYILMVSYISSKYSLNLGIDCLFLYL